MKNTDKFLAILFALLVLGTLFFTARSIVLHPQQ